jgi:hypothetical protein
MNARPAIIVLEWILKLIELIHRGGCVEGGKYKFVKINSTLPSFPCPFLPFPPLLLPINPSFSLNMDTPSFSSAPAPQLNTSYESPLFQEPGDNNEVSDGVVGVHTGEAVGFPSGRCTPKLCSPYTCHPSMSSSMHVPPCKRSARVRALAYRTRMFSRTTICCCSFRLSTKCIGVVVCSKVRLPELLAFDGWFAADVTSIATVNVDSCKSQIPLANN